MEDEKYRLQLEGSQIDDALQQLNQRVAEGWAVGTRDGAAVPQGSEYYNNNAKYYAGKAGEQKTAAEAAAARAEAAVPAGTEGAVLFTVDQSEIMTEAQKAVARNNIDAASASDSSVVKATPQTFTTAQQAQARANIMAGGSNDNLLDNWYFVGGGSQLGDGKFPINQRGQTSYSGNGNTGIDRWKVWLDATVTLNADGVSVSGGTNIGIVQYVPQSYRTTMQNKTMTYSVLFTDGTLATHTFALTTEDSYNDLTAANGIKLEFAFDGYPYFLIYSQSGQSFGVVSAKLELGTVSTLVNDAPPDFGEELAKCKRRLRYVPLTRTPAVISGNAAVVTLNGIEMASVPTPALISAGGARDAGGVQSITSATVTGFTYNTPTVQFTLAGNLNYVIGYVYDTVIQLSCEL